MATNPEDVMRPRTGFFSSMNLAAQKRQQQVISRTLNEEIEREIGDSTNVNLQEVLPKAYFNAARRIAELGNAGEAQQLYAAGVQAMQSTAEHAAKLNTMRAQAGDLDEEMSEYLETLKQRDALNDRIGQFSEDTPTGKALRERMSALNERLTVLNERGLNVPAPPREILLARQFDADREVTGGKPGTAEEVWMRERQTSGRAQDYANYVQQETAAGRRPVPYDQWTPSFQGDIEAGQTLGGEGMKSLFTSEQSAKDAVASLNSIQSSLDLLNEGARTGTGADVRQWVARAAATFLGDDPSQATVNTDAYIATSAPRVVQIVRALAPVTDQDKEYIQAAVGGNLNAATPEAMRKLLEIAARSQTRMVQQYNDRLSRLGEVYNDVSDVFSPLEAPSINFAAPELPAAAPTIINYDAQGRRVR